MDYVAYLLIGSLAVAFGGIGAMILFVPDEQDQQNR